MFEQRLVFASTPRRPQTIWLSRAGDYENFSASRPVKADDSIEATIASSEVSTAQWMIALRSLMLGTTNVEWEIASSEGAFTAKTMKVSAQSYRGSTSLPALVIGTPSCMWPATAARCAILNTTSGPTPTEAPTAAFWPAICCPGEA
jgi:hypothetical protein